MGFKVVESTLASAVADAGTFTVSYPSRDKPDPAGYYNEGDFYGAFGHKMQLAGASLVYPDDFDLTFGTSSITVTNKTGASWASGSAFKLQLEVQGKPVYRGADDPARSIPVKQMNRMAKGSTFLVNLGAPDVADADGFCVSQDLTSAGVFSSSTTATAAIAAAALAGVCDVPRNVVAAWTGTAVLTITGKDEYGNTIVEKSASGTSLTGKKAFKQVTGISSSANITSLTVGTGNVIGLPFRLPNKGHVLAVMQDGVRLPPVTIVPFEIEATELGAGTSEYVVTPNAGIIERATVVVQEAIVTGGDVTFELSNVAVAGLTCTVANSATVGTVVSDTPTTTTGADTTTQVAARGAIEVVPASAFNGGGALNGYIEINSQGVFQAAAAVAGGQVATSADVRGTFHPPVLPDGDIVWQVLVSLPDPDMLGQDQYAG